MIYARRVELHVVDLTIISKIFITITITSGYISLYGIKGLNNFLISALDPCLILFLYLQISLYFLTIK